MRSRRLKFSLLICWLVLLNVGCSYMVKNDRQQTYLKSKYGVDKFVVIRGYNIHYVEVGEGEPVILIPGAFSTYRHWNQIIPHLSKYYKLICLDYLGTGDSDKPSSGFGYTIEEQTDLLVKMMETLNIQKAPIVGVSYGGAIALNLAARYPDQVGKIICVEGNGIKYQTIPYRFIGFLKLPVFGEFFIGAIRSGIADGLVAKSVMGKAWETMSEKEKKEVTEIIALNNKLAARVSWYRISHTIKNSKDFTHEAKRIQTPILYVYGGNSFYHEMAEMNAEFLKTHLSNVKIVLVNEGIHDLELQKPEELSSLTVNFLGKQGAQEQTAFTPNIPFVR